MKNVPQMFKKVAVTTVLSTCLVGSMVSSAFASVTAGNLGNKVGNELLANFTITDAVDTVVLSWDQAALEKDPKSYTLAKGSSQTVTYHVKPGAENDDDLTVSVLLKVPTLNASAIGSLKAGGNTLSLAFTDGGYSYYILKEGLDVAVGAASQSGTFDIAFSQVSSLLPHQISLIAINENAPAPVGIKSLTPTLGLISHPNLNPEQQVQASITFNTALPLGMTGTAVVKLDGIESFDVAGSTISSGGVPISNLTSYWNAQTKTLTFPASQMLALPTIITLKDAKASSTAGSYSIKASIDFDGVGTLYSPSDELSIPFVINYPG